MTKSDKTEKPEDTLPDSKLKAEGIKDEGTQAAAQDVDESEVDEVIVADEDQKEDAIELENPEGTDEHDLTDQQDTTDAQLGSAEQTKDEDPKENVGEAVTAAPSERSGSSALPMFIGGIVAAAIGFGASSYLGSQGILFGTQSADAVEDLARQIDDQNDLIKLLQSNQDKIAETANQANESRLAVDEANARVAALSERLEALGSKTQALEGRIIEVEKRPMTEGASSVAIEAYEREVEQLRAMVAEQLKEAESLKETSARTAQETMAQAALTRIVSAVDTGIPYRVALTELASVSGVSIPSDLSQYADKGVPTNLALADAFPEYAREALADARKLESDGENRISHFLKSQLGARSTEPKEGTDADAVLSRAEAALREGRLAASLEELTGLPESSQAIMSDWRDLAETRLAATRAVEALAQSLNSN